MLIKHRTPHSTLDRTGGEPSRVSAFGGFAVRILVLHFPGVRSPLSDGHVRFELVSSRGVRLDVSHPTHIHTHSLPDSTFHFPKTSRYLTRSGHSDAPRRSEPVLSTSGFVHLPGTAEVTRSVSRHDPPPPPPPNPSVCISVYLSQKAGVIRGYYQRSVQKSQRDLPIAIHTAVPAALQK